MIHMSTTEINHTAEKSRSYDVRVRRGQTVRTLRPVLLSKHDGSWNNWEYVTVPAGTELVASSNDTNAGFRGIEAHVRYGDGFSISVSTGALEIVR